MFLYNVRQTPARCGDFVNMSREDRGTRRRDLHPHEEHIRSRLLGSPLPYRRSYHPVHRGPSTSQATKRPAPLNLLARNRNTGMDDGDIPALEARVVEVVQKADKDGEIDAGTFTMKVARVRIGQSFSIDGYVTLDKLMIVVRSKSVGSRN